MMDSPIKVQKALDETHLLDVFSIRRQVFVKEQGVPASLEYDLEDESHHFLALCGNVPCGAARRRNTDEGYKLERFAVLPQFRKKGVGSALLRALLNDLPDKKRLVYLNAQLPAMRLYESFGFICVGELFEEAGMMHQRMEKGSGE
jgi:predicted GNAT family N-acyltransferase